MSLQGFKLKDKKEWFELSDNRNKAVPNFFSDGKATAMRLFKLSTKSHNP